MFNNSIITHHLEEWEKSSISEELIKENLISLNDNNFWSWFFDNNNIKRTNGEKLSRHLLRKYENLSLGGWTCKSVEPLTGELMDFGQFKADVPRKQIYNKNGKKLEKAKPIKYENKPKYPARALFPSIPYKVWLNFAHKYEDFNNLAIYSNFWEWLALNPDIPIIITEGVKKALSLLSLGYPAIALTGVNMGFRRNCKGKKELIPDLQLFNQKRYNKQRTIYIAFDNESEKEKINRVEKMTFALASLFGKARIIEWRDLGQYKGIDDLIGSLENPQEQIEEIINKSKSFEFWANQYLFNSREGDLNINSQYLTQSIHQLPERKLIALKSVQNTGKTELLVNQVQRNKLEGRQTLVLTHRESLGKALATRFNLAYRTDEKVNTQGFGIALCVDSLFPKTSGIQPEDWIDCDIIIDEVEQVLEHLINSKTEISKVRPKVLNTFIQLLENASRVIIADADISNTSIKFFEGLLDCECQLIENKYKYQGRNYFSYPTAQALTGFLIDAIGENQKIFVTTSSQKRSSTYGSIALENLITNRFPDKKILRVDSESISDPNHEAFRSLNGYSNGYEQDIKLNQIISQYDIVIASPSIETGVSINIKNHFDLVISFSSGNIQPHNFIQHTWRLRDSIDRHFFAPKTGIGYAGNGSSSPNQLLDFEDRKIRKNIACLSNFDHSLILSDSSPFFSLLWAKLCARKNASNKCYREITHHLIEQQGHQLEILEGYYEFSKDELKENKEELIMNHHLELLNAPELSSEQVKRLKDTKELTKTQSVHLQAHLIKEKYGHINEEILEADEENYYPQLKLWYFLTVGDCFAEKKDLKIVEQKAEHNNHSIFLWDFNKGINSLKLKILNQIGIFDLLDEAMAGGINQTCDSIQHIWEQANQNKEAVKMGLGITVGQSCMVFFKKLFALIGYKLKRTKILSIDGKRVHNYETKELPEWTNQTLAYWLKNDAVTFESDHKSLITNITDQYPQIAKYLDPTTPPDSPTSPITTEKGFSPIC